LFDNSGKPIFSTEGSPTEEGDNYSARILLSGEMLASATANANQQIETFYYTKKL